MTDQTNLVVAGLAEGLRPIAERSGEIRRAARDAFNEGRKSEGLCPCERELVELVERSRQLVQDAETMRPDDKEFVEQCRKVLHDVETVVGIRLSKPTDTIMVDVETLRAEERIRTLKAFERLADSAESIASDQRRIAKAAEREAKTSERQAKALEGLMNLFAACVGVAEQNCFKAIPACFVRTGNGDGDFVCDEHALNKDDD